MLEFSQDEHDTWDRNSKGRADAIVNAAAQSRVPGDTYKDFYVEAVYTKNKSMRTYVPFWITTYNYGEDNLRIYGWKG